MKDEEKEESHLWGFFKCGAERFALFLYPFVFNYYFLLLLI